MVGSYFGFKCPRCLSTVAAATGRPTCPSCGTPMVPDPQGQTVAAKAYCPRCKAAYGLLLSDRCPECQGPL